MSLKSHGLIPVADHERIHHSNEPRLRGLAPALFTPLENADQVLNKAVVTINRAGSDTLNPALKGLGQRFTFITGQVDRLRSVFIFQDRRALGPNLIASVVAAAPGVFTLDTVIGAGISKAGPSLGLAKRNFIRWEGSFGTSEKEFYAKDKDPDVIVINAKRVLDDNFLPTGLQLSKFDASFPFIKAAIDFFPSWNDAFHVQHNAKSPLLDPGFLKAYGGAKFVSFFDTNLPIPATRFSKLIDEPFGPGLATLNSTQTIAGLVGNITKVTIGFHILIFNTNVLQVRLIAPDSTTIDIAINRGGILDFGTACTDDTTKTIADDSATLTFFTGSNPFTGPHKPAVALSGLNGKSGAAINGTWTLQIMDTFAGSPGGTLKCWHVEIETDGLAPGVEGSGTQVKPVTEALIDTLRDIEIENVTGVKKITVRFRSKASSIHVVDCPIEITVVFDPALTCTVPVIEDCVEVLLLVGTPLPVEAQDAASVPGVQDVVGTVGVPLTRNLLYLGIRSAIAGSAAKLRVQKWAPIASAPDLAGARVTKVADDVYLPLVFTSGSPLSGVPYQAPQRLTVAMDVLSDTALNVGYYTIQVVDGDLVSDPVLVLGPNARALQFFPTGGTGGGDLCTY